MISDMMDSETYKNTRLAVYPRLLTGGDNVNYVTYSDLFTFGLFIIELISLILQVKKK